MRDLLVITHTPVLRSGQAMRTYGLARALAVQGGLDLLYVRFGGEAPDAAFSSIPGIELHAVEPSRGVRRLLSYGKARLRGVPDGLARGISAELVEAAGRLAGEERRAESSTRAAEPSTHPAPLRCGRVIADGPTAAAALGGMARRRPVIYNAHNLESGFRHELDERRIRRFFAARTLRSFERRILRRFTESWMVSEADMAAAHELCPQAHLRYVPNVVDVTAIDPIWPPSSEPRAIFVASFSYEPNRNAARFLLEEVFPRVWQELPEARLALVGAGLEQALSSDPRVEALGFVEDLRAAYATARCAVVPLLQGGGTPLKLIEALAYGLPVIATSRAVAGLQVRNEQECLLADDAASFAAALVRVLQAGAPELGRRGRELAAERYSIEALSDLVKE